MNEAMRNWSVNPTNIDIPRSKQKMMHSHKTTYNTGRLVPIYWREVIPGSTVKMTVSEITRMQTPIFPVMDNGFVDTMFFFVPNRLLWEHWEEFMGENKHGIWEQKIEYEVPQIEFNHDNTQIAKPFPSFLKGDKAYRFAVQAGSLADYLGVPIVDANNTASWRGKFEVNALPFRAYEKIYNDWWRDENLMYPIEFSTGDATIRADISAQDEESSLPLSAPKYIAKFHDYFTSALPQPQKHDDVLLPLGNSAPVVYGDTPANYSGYTLDTNLIGKKVAFGSSSNAGQNLYLFGMSTDGNNTIMSANKSNNIVADLSAATGATINALRQAFAVQRFYERQARGGSRYIEQLKSMFGVTSPDARLQRSEYLGGHRQHINIDQVIQTSETGTATPQGNVSGYSLTTQSNELFTKSFVEHGILMGVQVVRTEHSYQDGLNKMWNRKTMFDYYNPVFANLGEMPIYNKELYLAGEVTGSKDEEVFGYQEPWAEYRYMNNRISGEMRSKYFQSLDAWHWADNYAGLPSLSSAWLEENERNVNRTIAVQDTLADQWMSDIFFEEVWTQPMPTYSIPGLIDHH